MAKNVLEASSDVLDILRSADIDDTGLTLTAQLDRAQYVAVNKFLETAGAKWNRKAKRHVFETGAKERIDALFSTGSLLDEKKAFQAFHTPPEIAAELAALATVGCPGGFGWLYLEPSVGHGAIAEAIRAADARARMILLDINPDVVPVLKAKGLGAMVGDFLSFKPDVFAKFDRVVMNPPFSGDQDIKHVRHAFGFLREGGKLIAIMSPGFTFGETRIRREFRDFVEKHGRIVEELPEGTFKESGTNVRTVVIELTK